MSQEHRTVGIFRFCYVIVKITRALSFTGKERQAVTKTADA